MKNGGGKRKGSGFERKVCWALSRFIDPESQDTFFWRSAMSGGRATQQLKKGIANASQLGDLTSTHEAGMWMTNAFVIECKFYRSLDLEAGLLFGRGKLSKFWKQVCKLARENDKYPLLIARQNRTDILVIFDPKGFHVFNTFRTVEVVPLLTSNRLGKRQALVYSFKGVFE